MQLINNLANYLHYFECLPKYVNFTHQNFSKLLGRKHHVPKELVNVVKQLHVRAG